MNVRPPIQVVVLVLAATAASGAWPWLDPARDAVRVRLILGTTGVSAGVTAGAAVANASGAITAGPASATASVAGSTFRVDNPNGGAFEAQFQFVATRVAAGGSVTWTVERPGGDAASLEVVNVNDLAAPSRVDRFEIAGNEGTAVTRTTAADLLRARGPLSLSAVSPRLVLAHYYPWYDRSTWNSPQLLDQPARLYSCDDDADVKRQVQQAKQAGIDGFVVSWQGKDFDGGWNDRRLRLVQQAARSAGLKVTTLLETTVANPQHEQTGVPTDPDTVLAWLTDILDLYSSDPTFVRAGDRPVIFVYAANRLKPVQWTDLRARLRANGRNPLLIAENTSSTWLPPFDGEFDYASNRFSIAELFDFDLRETSRVRTYDLLGEDGGARRIWAATVSPGYDDTKISDGRQPRVTDRSGGAYYEAQWNAALESAPDWILITSWNEWWENTEIEPSRRFGDYYLKRTRFWSYVFHTASR